MKLGRYEVLSELGKGGMGVVHRARSADGRAVAVKVLKKGASPVSVARFERERRLLAELDEKAGFVPLLDSGESAEGPWFAMPLFEGGTLRARLLRGALPVEEARRLGVRLARAMGRAHARGIVHRDLKPENVLLDGRGDAFIADLGLAKHFDVEAPGASRSVALSRTGEVRGTVGYMAPEQWTGTKDQGPPVDVFALGAIVHECITGTPVFDGPTLIDVYNKIRSKKVPPLKGPIGRVVARALAVDPALRPEDGEALARALEGARAPDRRLALAAALLLVAAGAGLAALLLGRSKPPPPPAGTGSTTTVAEKKTSGTPNPARSARHEPDWFLALPIEERPASPLPPGITIGEQPGEYRNAKDGSLLVFVPAGIFKMGNEDEEAQGEGRPIHEVELSAYFIGKYELTNEKFAAFVKATNRTTLAEKKGGDDWRHPQKGGAAALPDHPVVNIAWQEAHDYCTWAGLRLPTEAEWERAACWDAKAFRSRRFAWGDDTPNSLTPRYANLADEALHRAYPERDDIFRTYDDGFAETAPVGSFPLGVSPVGALDMTGNAAEWCEDSYDPDAYRTAPRRDPLVENASRIKVARGGSWLQEWWRARATYRNYPDMDYALNYLGARVARSAR